MPAVVSRFIEVCIYRLESQTPSYLLLRRSEGQRLYPGIWQFVSGKVKEGEGAVQAALRELREETGFAVRRLYVVPHVNSFYMPEDDAVHVCPFFAVEVGNGEDPALSAEHQSFGWFSYEEARGKLVWPGQRQGLELVHRYILGGEEAGRLAEMAV